MSGWQVIIWGGACATGALLFLTIVAHAIADVVGSLDEFEARQKRALRKECAEDEPVVAQAVLGETPAESEAPTTS